MPHTRVQDAAVRLHATGFAAKSRRMALQTRCQVRDQRSGGGLPPTQRDIVAGNTDRLVSICWRPAANMAESVAVQASAPGCMAATAEIVALLYHTLIESGTFASISRHVQTSMAQAGVCRNSHWNTQSGTAVSHISS